MKEHKIIVLESIRDNIISDYGVGHKKTDLGKMEYHKLLIELIKDGFIKLGEKDVSYVFSLTESGEEKIALLKLELKKDKPPLLSFYQWITLILVLLFGLITVFYQFRNDIWNYLLN